MVDEVVFICITPVKNEAWILPYFLEMNSCWADKFIVVDQCSTDGSLEILRNEPKVILIENRNLEYDEAYRSELLWNAAREIKAEKRIIIALDADEFIPPSLVNSREWQKFTQLAPGTRIFMKWIQLLPGLKQYYHFGDVKPFGYIDDGQEIAGKKMHNERVPHNSLVKPYYCTEVLNLHLGDVPQIRNYKKHSWYLMWEYLNKGTSPLDLNINYRKSRNLPEKEIKVIDEKWIPAGTLPEALDIQADSLTWWDLEILNWLKSYGEARFKRIDIWDYNWNLLSEKVEYSRKINDPRSLMDKAIMQYINKVKYRKNIFLVRMLNSVIRLIWQ